MKPRLMLPLSLLLLAACMFAGSQKAGAFEIDVSIGGSRHHRNRTVVEYRTSDPVYTTWYPERSTAYVYVPTEPTVYYYEDGYPTTRYIYSTESPDYRVWYGRGGRGGWYDQHGVWHRR